MSDLLHQRLGKAHETELARIVCCALREGILPRQAPDIDYPAIAHLPQVRDSSTSAVEDTIQVRLEHTEPLVITQLGDWLVDGDPGIVRSEERRVGPECRSL